MDCLFARRILIIDGNAETLSKYLEELGNLCRIANTLQAGRAFLAAEPFDGVISEWVLPDGKAADLLGEGIPPLVVYSDRTDDADVIDALSHGAADYVFKPCSPRVLALRLFLRLPPRGNRMERHGLALDMDLRAVTYRGQPVKLTSSEFNILCFLMAHPGIFFPADTIYEKVWNASSMQTSVVRFHIANLKRALLAATGKNLIFSEFGAGYAFAKESDLPK